MPVYKACIGSAGSKLRLSVEDYDRCYGKNHLERPYCPVCDIELFTHAVSSLTMKPSFHHPRGNPNKCDLVGQTDDVFSTLKPQYFDESTANTRRNEFYQDQNIKRAYQFMHKMCGKGNFGAKLFNQCIKMADALNIWAYRDLKQWGIPFILLTMTDFKHTTKGYMFRFTLKKSEGCSLAYWQSSEACSLLRVFASGDPMIKDPNNPYPISKQLFIEMSKGNDWISGYLLTALKANV
ncbi:MAG: hypothetical protein ACRCTY_02295 [Candidatus Adiutrix sp.]